jgi:arsenate reductase
VSERPRNVLFLCTGNSARSIIAECLLNHMAKGRFKAFSAGSHPGGTMNPLVLEYLHSKGINTAGARSKSWDEFAAPDSPRMDLIVTVCDQAAGEACPVWPGHPSRAHWSAPDPAAYLSDPRKARQVIGEVFQLMQQRISLLLGRPMETLDPPSLEREAQAIAERAPADNTHATDGT